MKAKVKKVRNLNSIQLLLQICKEDYRSELDRYYKMYDRMNIALCFNSAVLLVILGNMDFSNVSDLMNASTFSSFLSNLIPLLISITSSILIVSATICLLILIRGREIQIINSVEFVENNFDEYHVNDAVEHLIEAYSSCTVVLREVIAKKQKSYDCVVAQIIVSLLLYAINILL